MLTVVLRLYRGRPVLSRNDSALVFPVAEAQGWERLGCHHGPSFKQALAATQQCGQLMPETDSGCITSKLEIIVLTAYVSGSESYFHVGCTRREHHSGF